MTTSERGSTVSSGPFSGCNFRPKADSSFGARSGKALRLTSERSWVQIPSPAPSFGSARSRYVDRRDRHCGRGSSSGESRTSSALPVPPRSFGERARRRWPPTRPRSRLYALPVPKRRHSCRRREDFPGNSSIRLSPKNGRDGVRHFYGVSPYDVRCKSSSQDTSAPAAPSARTTRRQGRGRTASPPSVRAPLSSAKPISGAATFLFKNL